MAAGGGLAAIKPKKATFGPHHTFCMSSDGRKTQPFGRWTLHGSIAQAMTLHAFSECGQMRPVSRKLAQVPVRLTACISSTAMKPLSVHTLVSRTGLATRLGDSLELTSYCGDVL